MFEAIILVCAATISGGVSEPCVDLTYSKGSLPTEEECQAAIQEMKVDIDQDPIFQYYLWDLLDRPEMLARKWFCAKTGISI